MGEGDSGVRGEKPRDGALTEAGMILPAGVGVSGVRGLKPNDGDRVERGNLEGLSEVHDEAGATEKTTGEKMGKSTSIGAWPQPLPSVRTSGSSTSIGDQ